MLNHDFERGVFLFEKTSKAGKRYYSVACPMPDEYEYTPVEIKNDRPATTQPTRETKNDLPF